jgi:hypothetical protein
MYQKTTAAAMYGGEASAEDNWDRVEDVMGGGGSGGRVGRGLDEDDDDNNGDGSSDESNDGSNDDNSGNDNDEMTTPTSMALERAVQR